HRVLLEASRAFSSRKGVVTVHWGLRHRDGVQVWRRALVVVVGSKRSSSTLLPREALPKMFSLQHGNRYYDFPIDVAEIPEAEKQGGDVRLGLFASVTARQAGVL